MLRSGATGTGLPQNGGGMSNINQPSGWRKATAGLAAAEQLAQKPANRVAVPKVTGIRGCKARRRSYRPQGGRHAAPRHARGLHADSGLGGGAASDRLGLQRLSDGADRVLALSAQAPCAAPGRDRRDFLQGQSQRQAVGPGDADGVIIEAYGFDLSPLSARVEEFEQLQAELQAERELCQRLKRQITVARRMIRARIEAALSGALRGPWTHLAGLFEDLLDRLPRRNTASETLERLLAWFRELQERVEAAYLKAVRTD